MKTPIFWKNNNTISNILAPLSCIYYFARYIHIKISKEYKSDLNIICVGNITAGGNGKTPVALKIADILKENNISFAFLSKGYKGKIKKFTQVDKSKHKAQDVGDEPLLLAQKATTFICKSRKQALIELSKLSKSSKKHNYQYIIMDDGLQNPTIFKNKNILVVDGGYGFGNKKLIPAGPLRETISNTMNKIDFIILIGKDKYNLKSELKKYNKEIIKAEINEKNVNKNTKDKFVAFCGLGRPQKFFDSLKKAKYNTIQEITFADHHNYTANDIENLSNIAKNNNAKLITTKKDWVKFPENFKKITEVLEIDIEFSNINKFKDLILK